MNIQTVIAMHVFTLGNKKKQTTNTCSDTNLQNKILSEKKSQAHICKNHAVCSRVLKMLFYFG